MGLSWGTEQNPAFENYINQQGRHVVGSSSTSGARINLSSDDQETIENAFAATWTICAHHSTSNCLPNSLVFSKVVSGPDILPWAISATSMDPDESRTWYFSFRGKQCTDGNELFSSTFENMSFFPCRSSAFPTGSIADCVDCNTDSTASYDPRFYDPRFALSLLAGSVKHKVVFCGYSLGGVVALVQFLNLLKRLKAEELVLTGRLRCITFGSPLIGDSRFAEDLRKLSEKAAQCNSDTGLRVQPVISFIYQHDHLPKIVATACNASLNSRGRFDHRPILAILDRIFVQGEHQSVHESALAENETALRIPDEYISASSDRAYVGAGCIVAISESGILSWCSPQQAGQLLGHYQTIPLMSCFKDRTFLRFYGEWLASAAQPTTPGRPRHHPELEPQLIDPEIINDYCHVVKSGPKIEVMIAGKYVHWLREAIMFIDCNGSGAVGRCACRREEKENVGQDEEVKEAEDDFSNFMGPTERVTVSSTHLTDIGLQVANFSAQLPANSNYKRVAEHDFIVTFFTVFGDPVVWRPGLKIKDILNSERGTFVHTGSTDVHVVRDHRFSMLDPCNLIDVAALRMAFILRSSRLHSLEMLLSSPESDELLVENWQPGIHWLRECREAFQYLLKSAHPEILLEAPHELASLLYDGGDRPNVERVCAVVDSITFAGLNPPNDVGRGNEQMSHLPQYLVAHTRCSRLRLLHMFSREGVDLSLLLDKDMKSVDFKSFNTIEIAAGSFAAIDHANRVSGPDDDRGAIYCPDRLVDDMIRQCLPDSTTSIGVAVVGIRALARSPFKDNTLTVCIPHRTKSGSVGAGVKLIGLSALILGTVGMEVAVSIAFPPVAGLAATVAVVRVAEAIGEQLQLVDEDFQLFKDAAHDVKSQPPVATAATLRETVIRRIIQPPLENRGSLGFKSNRCTTEFMYGTVKSAGQSAAEVTMQHTKIVPNDHETIYHQSLKMLLLALRDPFSPSGCSAPIVTGDLFSLECELHRRIHELRLMDAIRDYDSAVNTRLANELFAEGADSKTLPCFIKLVRASLQMHKLRQLLASTFVICIVGLRGSGKSTIARNCFGVNAVCGAENEHSTREVQSHYIPVEGDGAVNHLLILDHPGSDDVTAHSSLFGAEGFAVADLVIVANRQQRPSSEGLVRLFESVEKSLGGIDEAVAGRRYVCSWDRHTPVTDPGDDDLDESNLWRQESRSICKLMLVMTHADEHLNNVVRDREENGSRSGPNVTNDASEQDQADTTAIDLAVKSWDEIGKTCESDAAQFMDKIAVANLCAVEDCTDRTIGRNRGIVKRALLSGAILDANGLVSFLGRIVPPEVYQAIQTQRTKQENFHGILSSLGVPHGNDDFNYQNDSPELSGSVSGGTLRAGGAVISSEFDGLSHMGGEAAIYSKTASGGPRKDTSISSLGPNAAASAAAAAASVATTSVVGSVPNRFSNPIVNEIERIIRQQDPHLLQRTLELLSTQYAGREFELLNRLKQKYRLNSEED